MDEENDRDHVEGDAVEGVDHCVSREEVQQASNEMKTGKAPEPSEVSLQLIAVCLELGIQVMVKLSQSSKLTDNAS